ncbi:hypothetical protein GCM10009841_32370 [Microlunatus panaciterrae]
MSEKNLPGCGVPPAVILRVTLSAAASSTVDCCTSCRWTVTLGLAVVGLGDGLTVLGRLLVAVLGVARVVALGVPVLRALVLVALAVLVLGAGVVTPGDRGADPVGLGVGVPVSSALATALGSARARKVAATTALRSGFTVQPKHIVSSGGRACRVRLVND